MATYLGNSANKSLTNLSELGNARSQYIPSSINNGYINEHLSYYNVTPVGSFTGNYNFTTGEYTGFSASNYLELPYDFDVSGGQPWEMVWEVTTSSSISGEQDFLGSKLTSSASDPVVLGISSSGTFCAWICYNSTMSNVRIDSGFIASTSTTYTIKFEFTGTEYKLYIDGVLKKTLESSTLIYSSNIIIGAQSSGSGLTVPWLGSVNLRKCYININGKRWWQGPTFLATNGTLYCGASATGSLTNNNGIISGFSASDYLNILNYFDVSEGQPWEMVWEVTTGSSPSTTQYFLGTSNSISSVDPIVLGLYNGTMGAWLGYNSLHSVVSMYGTTSIQANTTYTIKFEFTGSAYNLYVNDNLDATLSSSTPIYASNLIIGAQLGASALLTPWLGSVNINNSYIKVNDELVWDGSTALKITCKPCTITSNKGVTLVDNNTVYYDASERNGTYYVLKRVTDGSIALVSNFVASPTEPTGTKSYWLDTSTVPYTQKRWSSSSEWLDDETSNSFVCIGKCSVVNGIPSGASNFSFNIDTVGEWLYKTTTLTGLVNYPTSTNTVFDMSDVFPDDGCVYEVLLISQCRTPASAGYLGVQIFSDIIPSYMYITYAHTRNGVSNYSCNSMIIPVGTERTVTVKAVSSYTGTYNLAVRGYRRLGFPT